jgi:DNA-binding beta-propeller fold protein YncE
LSPNGNFLYASDDTNGIQVFNISSYLGKFVKAFGSPGIDNGQFMEPSGICTSQDGHMLFVADTLNKRVQKVNVSDGAYIGTIGIDQFKYPTLVCLSQDGKKLFVADSQNYRVQVLNASDGSYIRTIGSERLGGMLMYPTGICLSKDNEHLFIVDSNGYIRIFKVSDGTFISTIKNIQENIKGLCLSPKNDSLLVLCNNSIRDFAISDGVLRKYYKFENFNNPSDICISSKHNLIFVADTGNNIVQVLRASDGTHMCNIGSKDNGQFNQPKGVCLSPNGESLFVTDENNRVQVFEV